MVFNVKRKMATIENNIKTVRVKAYQWQCPKCGKRLISLSKTQLIALAKSHMLKHESE